MDKIEDPVGVNLVQKLTNGGADSNSVCLSRAGLDHKD